MHVGAWAGQGGSGHADTHSYWHVEPSQQATTFELFKTTSYLFSVSEAGSSKQTGGDIATFLKIVNM